MQNLHLWHCVPSVHVSIYATIGWPMTEAGWLQMIELFICFSDSSMKNYFCKLVLTFSTKISTLFSHYHMSFYVSLLETFLSLFFQFVSYPTSDQAVLTAYLLPSKWISVATVGEDFSSQLNFKATHVWSRRAASVHFFAWIQIVS